MNSAQSGLQEWLVRIREDLHMNPEIANQEVRTTEFIISTLESLGVQVRRFDDITGAVGLIRGREPDRTIALRADIDALPVQEMNEVPYKSRNEGTMHACGHDAHTTIMLGVAKTIVETGLKGEMKGDVKFLFQPAEERVSGAREMISRGVLEDPHVDCVIACHMVPDLPVGSVGIYAGQSHASADRFSLRIKGKGTHGARPEEGIDPIVAGAHFVTAVQSVVSRNITPTDAAVVTVGKFHAGTVGNVIPEIAELEGTIRALEVDVRERIIDRMNAIVEGVRKTFGVECHFEFQESMPSCVNDEEVSAFLHETAADVLGADKVTTLSPSMGAEDFALFAFERPSAIIRLGCGNPEKGIVHPLHSPYFDIDERVLTVGVRVFTEAVKRYLA